MIQQTSRGTAEIMEDMEKFALNIAKFTNSFSYTPEFSIITPNISKSFDSWDDMFEKNLKCFH